MSQKTDNQLRTQANTIQNETVSRANSAARIGIMINDIIDSKANNLSGSTGGVTNSKFNTYTGATQTALNAKHATSAFNAYSASTATALNSKNSQAAFNIYSGATQTSLNSKLAITTFNAYTGSTGISGKLNTTAFNTYSGVTATRIGTIESNYKTGAQITNQILSGDTTPFILDVNSSSPVYSYKSNSDIKGQGKVILTNGSASISGVSSNFLDATTGRGLSYWFNFWVKDSANNWYRINMLSMATNTSATMSVAFSRTQLRYIDPNTVGSFIPANGSATFQGVSGQYDWWIVRNWSDGLYSSVLGGNNSYADNFSVNFGGSNVTIGQTSFAAGKNVFVSGAQAVGFGLSVSVHGNYSLAAGNFTAHQAAQGFSFGLYSVTQGVGSFTGGLGLLTGSKYLYSTGRNAFLFTENTAAQGFGSGLFANNAVILGGIDHTMVAGSNRSVILGGNQIRVNSAVVDTVFMPRVRIGQGSGGAVITTGSSTTILTLNATTGEIESRAASALFSTGSTVTSANNGVQKSGTNVRLGGQLTGSTQIGLGANNLTFSASTGTLRYAANYSANFVNRSIVDKSYVTGLTSSLTTSLTTTASNGITKSSTNFVLGGSLAQVTTISMGNNNFIITGNTVGNMRIASKLVVGTGLVQPFSSLDVVGSYGTAINTTITDLTLGISHHTMRVNASGSSRTINLPPATGCTRRRYVIKKIDNSVNTVTVDGNASETIDGATTKVLSTQYSGVEIQCNGVGWDVIGTF